MIDLKSKHQYRDVTHISSILLVAALILPLSTAQAWAQVSVAPPTYILSVPKLVKIGGEEYQPLGQTRMMTTTFSINGINPNSINFVVFLEIRDTDGVTVFLQFHSGIVEGRDGRVEVASSWQPEKEGKYELRTFAITNFTKPEVLVCCVSPVNVTIN